MTAVPAQHPGSLGTVTLVFTDIEGSTGLLMTLGGEYAGVLTEHHRIMRETFAGHGATERASAGDGLYFTVGSARAAVQAAIDAQVAIAAHPWPGGVVVRDRMGLHTGEPVTVGETFVGLDIHLAARICAAGHGGQVLVSQTTHDLVQADLRAPQGMLDLGVHRLRSLEAPLRLYQLTAPGLQRDFPPPRTTEAPRNNLKLEVSSFIGREREVDQAAALLERSRLVTLTGPGGVGKTRLGLHVARRLLAGFDDGVWIVELGSLTAGDFVLPTVMATLGLTEPAGRPLLAALVDHLAAKRVLLILDDADPVLTTCAEVAAALVRACSGVHVVVTSREALGVQGETILPVSSLGTPPVGVVGTADLIATDAGRLFVERASAVQPGFAVTERNAPSIAQLCRRLDGIPLAIELAAARVRSLPVEQIAARLDDRFRLLTGGSRVAVARHQTLRATMDWSYDLLAEPERVVLRRLSVFAAGASLEAAEAVCGDAPIDPGDVLDLLGRLIEKSLVVTDQSRTEARFGLLETVREYARERLVEADEGSATLRRHRDWYLTFVDDSTRAFFMGPEPVELLRRLDAEHDEIRAALEWCLDQPDEGVAGLRMASGLWRYWEIRGHLTEGRGWLQRMIDAVDEQVSPLVANALTGAGSLAFLQGDYRAASAFHERSLSLHRRLGDRRSVAFALNNLANAAVQLGDLERAGTLYQESVDIVSELGDVRAAALGSINLADVRVRQGDLAEARTIYEAASSTIRALGDRWMEAFALDAFAQALARAGDRVSARSLSEDALAILEGIGDARGVARLQGRLAELALAEGDVARAVQLHRRSLAMRQELGDLPGLASAMEGLAAALAVGEPQSAARLFGAAEALREGIRASLAPQAGVRQDQVLADLESRLGPDGFESARREGRAMTPNEALATLPL